VEHWFFLGHAKETGGIGDQQLGDYEWPAMPEQNHHDLFSEPTPTEEFLTDWLLRCCELVDRYHPRIVYFDWWIEHSAVKPWLKKFAAYYYNRAAEWGTEAVITYKHDAFLFGCAVPDVERGQFAEIKPFFWQTDTAIATNSWCYTEGNDYRPAVDLIRDLVDIVSKNGTLLLNVGPKSDGTLVAEEVQVLKKMGAWLSVNGEGIYGTKPWKRFGEGEVNASAGFFMDNDEKGYTSKDFRFTYKNGFVYAFQMRPDEQDVTIRSFAEMGMHDFGIKAVELLGGGAVDFRRDKDGLHIHLKQKPSADAPICFRVELV
jgi:alpha-L-fucosidase